MEILISWIKIRSKLSKDNTKKELIWNNKDIKCNEDTVFYIYWYTNGIKSLEHVFAFRTKTFYDFETLKCIYDINSNNFLKHHNILGNIPKRNEERNTRRPTSE